MQMSSRCPPHAPSTSAPVARPQSARRRGRPPASSRAAPPQAESTHRPVRRASRRRAAPPASQPGPKSSRKSTKRPWRGQPGDVGVCSFSGDGENSAAPSPGRGPGGESSVSFCFCSAAGPRATCPSSAELPEFLQRQECGTTETISEAPGAYGIRSCSHAARIASYETTSALATLPGPEVGMAPRYTASRYLPAVSLLPQPLDRPCLSRPSFRLELLQQGKPTHWNGVCSRPGVLLAKKTPEDARLE